MISQLEYVLLFDEKGISSSPVLFIFQLEEFTKNI